MKMQPASKRQFLWQNQLYSLKSLSNFHLHFEFCRITSEIIILALRSKHQEARTLLLEDN